MQDGVKRFVDSDWLKAFDFYRVLGLLLHKNHYIKKNANTLAELEKASLLRYLPT